MTKQQNIRESWNEFNKNHGHSNSEWEEQLNWFISHHNTTLKELEEKLDEDELCEQFDMEEGTCGMCNGCKVNRERQRIKKLINNKIIQ